MRDESIAGGCPFGHQGGEVAAAASEAGDATRAAGARSDAPANATQWHDAKLDFS
ncbi:hypothetical protein HUS73_21860, partial [Pandoraea nosoerga]|nr:hypothetical protein [Pandoraea nosoerga]